MSGFSFKRFVRGPRKGETTPIGVLPARPDGVRSRLLALQGFAARKRHGGKSLRARDWLRAQQILDGAGPPAPDPIPGRWRWDATIDGVRYRLVAEARDGRLTVFSMHERGKT